MISLAPKPGDDRTARPKGPLGGLTDQFYDVANKKVRWGGIIGAIIGGILGGHLLGMSPIMGFIGAAVGGLLGSWGGNATTAVLSRHFGHQESGVDEPSPSQVPQRERNVQVSDSFHDVGFTPPSNLPNPPSPGIKRVNLKSPLR